MKTENRRLGFCLQFSFFVWHTVWFSHLLYFFCCCYCCCCGCCFC